MLSTCRFSEIIAPSFRPGRCLPAAVAAGAPGLLAALTTFAALAAAATGVATVAALAAALPSLAAPALSASIPAALNTAGVATGTMRCMRQ